MARKKEPELEAKNRERIAQIAKQLFLNNGMENTTMSDIAKAAQMSKSTLYVYFKSKEEVRNFLSLEAMEYFHKQLLENVQDTMNNHKRFLAICEVLVIFKQKYPLNFQLLVEEICVDEEVLHQNQVLRQIYEAGEEINQFLFDTIGTALQAKSQVDMFLQIFSMWGKLYGIITLADNKESYIGKATGMTKQDFLQKNFELLYQSITWKAD